VQDAAYMVTVPFFAPDVPPLQKNPVFLYCQDQFQRPNPFAPDVIVAVDSVMQKKLDALGIMISQFAEGGANGSAELYPADAAGQAKRRDAVRDGFRKRQQGITQRYQTKLAEWYPGDKTSGIQFVEAFEICEYGSRPNKTELKRLFPFFD